LNLLKDLVGHRFATPTHIPCQIPKSQSIRKLHFFLLAAVKISDNCSLIRSDDLTSKLSRKMTFPLIIIGIAQCRA